MIFYDMTYALENILEFKSRKGNENPHSWVYLPQNPESPLHREAAKSSPCRKKMGAARCTHPVGKKNVKMLRC